MSWLRARDYSIYQGDVDFTQEPIDIALIKMSGGDSGLYVDPNAAINYQKAINASKGVMGWHFAGGTDPVAEADFAVRAMMPFSEGDVYGLDWEVQHSDPVGWVLAYENEFHAKTGCYAIPYMNGATMNAYDWSPVFNLVLPWLAWWGISPDNNAPVKYSYIIQQYDDSGTVVSNGSRVDEDAVFMSLDEFKAYGYHAPAPAPAPEPTPAPTPAPVVVTAVPETTTASVTVNTPVSVTTPEPEQPPTQSVSETTQAPSTTHNQTTQPTSHMATATKTSSWQKLVRAIAAFFHWL